MTVFLATWSDRWKADFCHGLDFYSYSPYIGKRKSTVETADVNDCLLYEYFDLNRVYSTIACFFRTLLLLN